MTTRQHIDIPTIIGWGMLLMPLLTMWHEIGGHAVSCLAQGGHVDTIGAFYVECGRLGGLRKIIVDCAGVAVNALLAGGAYLLWRRVRGDERRLALWLVWVSEGFVAVGLFLFLGRDRVRRPWDGRRWSDIRSAMANAWRAGELVFGVIAYIALVRAAIRGLSAMLGTSAATGKTRRRIAHVYYATAGAAAVVTGLLNPVGIIITIMSAAASSFGGLAGMISIGFAVPAGDDEHAFLIRRNWMVIAAGALMLLAFAVTLGPSRRF